MADPQPVGQDSRHAEAGEEGEEEEEEEE